MAASSLIWVLVLVIIAAIVVVAFMAGYKPTGGQNYYNTVTAPILLTDPPQVPPGTNAVVVTYSSLAVHTTGTNQSGWVNATGSGSVDLLTVTNSSQIVGHVTLAANSTINVVRFNITSATITVNGTTYNVSVPNSQLNVAIAGDQKINSTSTGVLIDFTPTISSNTSVNSTTHVRTTTFMMAGGATARVVVNLNVSASAGVGSIVSVNSTTGLGIGLH